jgi:hypothetical protein
MVFGSHSRGLASAACERAERPSIVASQPRHLHVILAPLFLVHGGFITSAPMVSMT